MGMTIRWLILFSVVVTVFFFGIAYGQTAQPHIAPRIEYIPKYVVKEVQSVKEIEVPKEVYPAGFRQFASQDELSKWQAKQYLELQEIGRKNNWVCVDYALEMQRRAWLDGYQMSVENLLDKGGKTGHAICSTWIGDKCIYLEPQNTVSWVGAVKGGGGLMYTPMLIYPETGQEVYREE